jgi:hypothetical protein
VLYDQKRPSPFIGEFLLRVEVGSYICPRCLEGKMVAIKDGETSNGDKYRSFVCSNHEGGCDFFETKYGDLTPPGIKITEEMTAQDVERLREARRNARTPRVIQALPTQYINGTFVPVRRGTSKGTSPNHPFAAPVAPYNDINKPKEPHWDSDDLPF